MSGLDAQDDALPGRLPTPGDARAGRLPTPDDADLLDGDDGSDLGELRTRSGDLTRDAHREGTAPSRGAEHPPPPRTGDIVADAALADLAAADPADLDAQLTTGEQVERTLRGRLADLGG